MRKIRVLYVVTTLGRGGVQEYIRQLASRLDRDRFDLAVAYGEPRHHETSLRELGVRLFPVPLVKPVSPLRDLRCLFTLIALLRRERFDLVHTHMTKASLLGRLAGRLTGCRAVVMTAHGYSGLLDYYFSSAAARAAFRRLESFLNRTCTDRIVLLTESDRRAVTERGIVPPEKVRLIHNGVDFADVEAPEAGDALRREMNIPSHAQIVLFIGRLARQKSPETLVAAAAMVVKRNDRVRFLLAGDGPKAGLLAEQIAAGGLAGHVRLLGVRSDVPALLQAADCFVLPSLYEGMPLSLLEAMAAGLPVVASRIPGNEDLVVEGETGLLVPFGDADALGEAILGLLEDPGQAGACGEAGRRRAREHFSLDKTAELTSRLYLELMEETGS